MSSPLSPQTVRAVARTALTGGRSVRFAMRGGSMLPLLRAPMVLVVALHEGRARLGDILVFAQGQTQVVHRVVGFAGDRYVTSGDAQPHITEVVAPADVLGRVESVLEHALPTARRVDGLLFCLRGYWYARSYQLRRRAADVKARAARAVRRLGVVTGLRRAELTTPHDPSR
jgi:hypothetical protein